MFPEGIHAHEEASPAPHDHAYDLRDCAQGLFLSRLPYTYVGWSSRYHTMTAPYIRSSEHTDS